MEESCTRLTHDWQALVQAPFLNQLLTAPQTPAPIPAGLHEAWHIWISALAADPQKTAAVRARFAEEQQRLLAMMSSVTAPPTAAHQVAGNQTADSQTEGRQTNKSDSLLSLQDKRFSTSSWQDPVPFRYLAESYLASYRLLLDTIDTLDLLSEEKQRLRFFAKQYADAVSPTNFLLTNPEALKTAMESHGESLRTGLENLQADISKGHISLTDESAFEVGKNIAVTPGSVVFENDIFQLLQYQPQSAEVNLRPLLMVPPCINKFYILDLRPDNSYIEYAVQQGFTVFVISWRNVSDEQGGLTWDDYLAHGVIKAIDVARIIANVHKLNVLGFCVGGTLLASALAVLKRMGHDVVESVTFLTTFLDFSEVGEISAYVDKAFVERREREFGAGGILNGGELAFAFSSLRANDLIWNYVANNYLQGKKPPPFDLLFWNGDSTNLAGPWYCYYLRNTYYENNLIKPDKLTMCGVPVDLGYVDMPAFVFAAKEDHIVPWRTAYLSAEYLGGKVEFVLGASGHIAGVINPAAKNKRSYWTNNGGSNGRNNGARHEKRNRKNAESLPSAAWLSEATEHEGSWWPCWSKWLKSHSGRMIPAPHQAGNATYPVIEAAPGRYVKVKCDNKR